MDRQLELLGRRDQHAAARGAVELGHHQTGHAGDVAEHLDLVQCVLAGGGVEDQHRVVRGGYRLFLQHAADLGEFVHQAGLVLEAAGGVDDQHVGAGLAGLFEGGKGQPRRVAAFGSGDDRNPGTLAPDLQLLGRRRPERVAGGQHDGIVLLGETVRQLGDGGGLAAAVDADDQDHLRPRKGDDGERLGDGCQHGLDLGSHGRADAGIVDGPVELVRAQPLDHPHRHLDAEIGADQRFLDPLQRSIVEARGAQAAEAELLRTARQAGAQLCQPACRFAHAHSSWPSVMPTPVTVTMLPGADGGTRAGR